MMFFYTHKELRYGVKRLTEWLDSIGRSMTREVCYECKEEWLNSKVDE